MVSGAISAKSFLRLSHFAEAYQRIRWKKLVFRIVPMSPTDISGGLCAGFVADASDVIGSNTIGLQRLLAQRGSKVFKAWEPATITHKCLPDLLYTSTPPRGDLRLSSPGRFVLMVDSKIRVGNGQQAPITVFVDWECSLSEPSVETDYKDPTGAVRATENLYGRSANVGLWFKDGPGGDDPRSVIPGIGFDVVYRLQSKRFCNFITSPGNYDRLKLVNDKTHGVTLAVLSYDSKPIFENFSTNCWMIEKGDDLIPEAPSENRIGWEFFCHQPTEGFSPRLGEKSQNAKKLLETCSIPPISRSPSLEILNLPLEVDYSTQDLLRLREQVKLMESRLN